MNARGRKNKKNQSGAVDKPQTKTRQADTVIRRLWPCSLLSLVLALVAIARVRLLGVPLERDEGEYAYIGQLMLQGVPPFQFAANMKLPGTDAAYALIMAVFGQTIYAIHLGLLLVNAGAIVLIYFIGRRLFDSMAGLAAAAAYAVLSVGSSVYGTWAHATHFVVLFALGGVLLLLKWAESNHARDLIWSGLLFGMAFLMKQAGAFFIPVGVVFLVANQWGQLRSRWVPVLRSLGLFLLVAAVPFGVTCLLLWRLGVFEKFWFWVFVYAEKYVGITTLPQGVAFFLSAAKPIAQANWAILLPAAAGLFLVWRDSRSRARAIFLTVFLFFSFLAVCPGLYFRQHYFVLVLPALALLAGGCATLARKTPAGLLPLWLIGGLLLFPIMQQEYLLFESSPLEACRLVYGHNPFPEALEVGNYLKVHSQEGARIVVLGSEPEIYFYASRRSVTPYLYLYPMFEPQPFAQEMQDEFIRDIETGAPDYLVVVDVPTSWSLWSGGYSETIFKWMRAYGPAHYDEIGGVDIVPDGAVYHLDSPNYIPKSSAYLIFFKRKGTGK